MARDEGTEYKYLVTILVNTASWSQTIDTVTVCVISRALMNVDDRPRRGSRAAKARRDNRRGILI